MHIVNSMAEISASADHQDDIPIAKDSIIEEEEHSTQGNPQKELGCVEITTCCLSTESDRDSGDESVMSSMAEIPDPADHQDDIPIAKESIIRKVEYNSTQGNLQKELGCVEIITTCSLSTESDRDSVDESLMSCNDKRQQSPVPGGISMMTDQLLDPPVAEECTVNIRPDSPSSLSSEDTDDWNLYHEREGEVVPCSACPKKAFKSCLTCMASYCDLHVKQHYTAQALQGHKLVCATRDMEQRLCQQHHKELELFCKTDQTPVCVLCVAAEHSGHEMIAQGRHENLQSYGTQMTSQSDDITAAVAPEHKKGHLIPFLEKIDLLKFYPNKLTLTPFLEIRRETMVDKEVESHKDVPLAFLRKLLMVNSKCRCHATVSGGETQRDDDDDEEEEDDDDDDDINPLDLVTALYLCADSFLQQEMSIKMSMCQFSVPFLLPQPDNNQCTLMLWALRNIYKEWCPHNLTQTKSYLEDTVVNAEIPLLSFVRLDNCSQSKSQLLNYVLSNAQQYVNFFTHRDMNGGNVPKKIANGLVEMIWCLPCGETNIDVFPEPVAIANMRGDISSNITQFRFLMQVSTAVFVCLDSMNNEEEKLLDLESEKSKLFLVINSEDKGLHTKYGDALKLQENHVLRRKPKLNMSKFSSKIIGAINMALLECKSSISIEQMSDTAYHLGISVDENISNASLSAKNTASEIMKGIEARQIAKYKKKQMPLQGKYLKDLAQIEIEECRLTNAGDLSLEKYKAQLQEKKCTLREQQGSNKPSQAMGQFIEALSTTDKEQRALFLKWMSLKLDRKSRNQLKELRGKYQQLCQDKDNKSITELDQQLLDNSLGIEHYMREMGQMYESKQGDNIRHLPAVAAELLLDGYPIELLNGEASYIPERWVTEVLMELHEKVGYSRVLVVSVLGVQSSGKSTLLNTMFGVQFPVSSGRCTRGAYMLFLSVKQELKDEIKCDFVLLIDTEGLKSPELVKLEDSYEHDNQLATLVIGLSDVTIINIAMENSVEMKDILQIVVHAFLRMSYLGKKPICHFVHQNVSGVSAHSKLMTDREHLLEQLDKMTRIAAEMENQSEVKTITDILHYDVKKNNWYIPGLWHGTPPMAPVNSGYSEAVLKFKNGLFASIKSVVPEDLPHIPDFLSWMSSLWKAVKHENFIFSFRNTVIAFAYDNLCKEFSGWEWSFRKCVYSWWNSAEAKISNTDTSELEDLSKKFKSEAGKVIEERTVEMTKNLKEYYQRKDRYVSLVEKYRTEFEISIKHLRREMIRFVENNLKTEVSLKRDMEKVEDIKKQQKDIVERRVTELLKICREDNRVLTDSDLYEEFEKMWGDVTRGILPLEEKDISSAVMQQLRTNMTHQNIQNELAKIQDLTQCGLEDFKVKKKKHITLRGKVLSLFIRRSIKSDAKIAAQNIIESCKRVIEDTISTNKDYCDIYCKELLEKIDADLRTNAKKTNKTFETDLKIHICGFAARRFLEMHRNFLLERSPLQHLQKSKEQYKNSFLDSFRERDQCWRKARNFTQLCIKPAVTDYINKSLGIEIIDEILSSNIYPQYSSRSYCQYTILSELLEKDDFESFVRCIQNYETFVKNWIHSQVVEWLSKDIGLVKLKSQILKTIFEKITKKIEVVQNDTNNTETATVFIERFCQAVSEDISLPMNHVREILFQMACKMPPFIDSLLQCLDGLKQQLERKTEENDIEDTLSTLTVKPQNEIFKRVLGCGVQCPFCKIPCEAGGQAHKHHATVHRPQGLARYHWVKTDALCDTICTTSIFSNAKFKNCDTQFQDHPYKKYRDYYPDWDIAPDPSIEASDYWKYVMVKYNDRFAQQYKAKPAKCPQQWHNITKEQALEGLKAAFNVK